MRLHPKVINYIAFNLIWFGLVVAGNFFVPLAAIWLVLHITFCNDKVTEAKLIGLVTLIGISLDSSLTYFGIYVFDDRTFIPMWLILLWANFASTINHSLHFLTQSKALQWFVGTVIAPLSYVAGYKLDAVSFGYPTFTTYMLLSLIWGGLLMLFYIIRDELFLDPREEPSHV